jgi:restriction system protein
MKDQFWGIGEKTPNRKNLKNGDKVVYYQGIPVKGFSGIATLASSCFELKETDKKKFSHEKSFYSTPYGVLLEEIKIWSKPKLAEELISQLTFIENKEFWFSYFQGGVRQISEDDYRIIIGEHEASLVEQISTTRDLESQTEFALETHLEEFIYQNWGKINWGANLELYSTDDQNGRQFPAETWSIDFLAIDKNNNDLVVIELKRGKTGDATVGQILRYITWVKENVATSNQNVRGIIIANDVDDTLRYSVKSLNNVQVMTYIVNFKLHPFNK